MTMTDWISVKDRLPEQGAAVLLLCERPVDMGGRKYQCVGYHAPRFAIEAELWDDECCREYCEEKDAYFIEAGWYELIYNWDEYSAVKINDSVVSWMLLPEPPGEEVEG